MMVLGQAVSLAAAVFTVPVQPRTSSVLLTMKGSAHVLPVFRVFTEGRNQVEHHVPVGTDDQLESSVYTLD